jgi:hypothetical protein
MTDGDSSAGRVRTYVPLVRRYFCSTVRTYMFVVRTRTHLAPKIKTERTKDKKRQKDRNSRNEKTKKIVSFLFKFSCSCLLFAVECCDRSGGVHCTLNCSSLTQSRRPQTSRPRQGRISPIWSKEGPKLQSTTYSSLRHIHKKYGTSSYRRLRC